MKELIENEKSNIGNRVLQLRNVLSLTQTQLAKAAGISKGTIAAIESGNNYSVDSLLAVINFFAMSVTEFMQFNQPELDELEFRKQIEEFHKSHNSDAYLKIPQVPNVINLIKHRLIKDCFLSVYRTVDEVVDYCNLSYGISLKSSVLSQALINATKSGILEREKSSGRKYLYKAVDSKD